MKLPRLTSSSENVRVEVLPLIDVIFIVLIAFVYAMIHMDVVSSVDITLPTLKPSKEEKVQDPIIVSMNSENELFKDGEKISIDHLIEELKIEVFAGKGVDVPVIVEGDQQADFGEALALLEKFRNNKITKISFRVKKAK